MTTQEPQISLSPFLDLPAELHTRIYDFLPQSDLAAVVNVCKKSYEIGSRLLYADPMRVQAGHEKSSALKRTLEHHAELARKVHSFHVWAEPSANPCDSLVWSSPPTMTGLNTLYVNILKVLYGRNTLNDSGEDKHSIGEVAERYPSLRGLHLVRVMPSKYPALPLRSHFLAELPSKANLWTALQHLTLNVDADPAILLRIISSSAGTLRTLVLKTCPNLVRDLEEFPVCDSVREVTLCVPMNSYAKFSPLLACFPAATTVAFRTPIEYSDGDDDEGDDEDDEDEGEDGEVEGNDEDEHNEGVRGSKGLAKPELEEVTIPHGVSHLALMGVFETVCVLPSTLQTLMIEFCTPSRGFVGTDSVVAICVTGSYVFTFFGLFDAFALPSFTSLKSLEFTLDTSLRTYSEQELILLPMIIEKKLPNLETFIIALDRFTKRKEQPSQDEDWKQRGLAIKYFEKCPNLATVSFCGVTSDAFPGRVWVRCQTDSGKVDAKMMGREALRWKLSEDWRSRHAFRVSDDSVFMNPDSLVG